MIRKHPAHRKKSTIRAVVRNATLAVAFTATVVLTGCAADEPQPPRRPNIVLITIDALRADFVSYAGRPNQTTPNLDRLAADSAIFTHAFTSFPGTTASMPSLMSGRFPNFEGIEVWNRTTHFGFNDFKAADALDQTTVPDDLRMLAEILSEHGYLTLGFNTNPHLGAANNFNQGFDEYVSFGSFLKEARENREHRFEGTYPPAKIVMRKVLSRIADVGDRPFFLWIHFMEPHSPYLPPPEHARRFPRQFSDAIDLDINEAVYHQLFLQKGAVTRIGELKSYSDLSLSKEAFTEHLLGLYEGEIRYCDKHLQRLFTALEDRGLWDETLTIVTADHGEEFFDHGFVMHHFLSALAEELIRIPLIIHPPGGIRDGLSIDQLVRIVDIAPTILDFAGLGAETEAMEGVSLRSTTRGEATPADAAFFSTIDFGIVRTERWKYRLEKRGGPGNQPVERLFDIIADPMESTDVLEANPQIAADLRARWLEHAEQLRLRARTRESATGGLQEELDEATREQLEALGYVDD